MPATAAAMPAASTAMPAASTAMPAAPAMSASVSAAPLGGGWQGRERGCERERRKQKYLVHCPSFGCEAPSLGFALRTSRRSLSTKRGACLGSVSKRSLARHDAQAEAHFCSCLIISIAFKAASMSVQPCAFITYPISYFYYFSIDRVECVYLTWSSFPPVFDLDDFIILVKDNTEFVEFPAF
jgi:hypothetical protein